LNQSQSQSQSHLILPLTLNLKSHSQTPISIDAFSIPSHRLGEFDSTDFDSNTCQSQFSNGPSIPLLHPPLSSSSPSPFTSSSSSLSARGPKSQSRSWSSHCLPIRHVSSFSCLLFRSSFTTCFWLSIHQRIHRGIKTEKISTRTTAVGERKQVEKEERGRRRRIRIDEGTNGGRKWIGTPGLNEACRSWIISRIVLLIIQLLLPSSHAAL